MSPENLLKNFYTEISMIYLKLANTLKLKYADLTANANIDFWIPHALGLSKM